LEAWFLVPKLDGEFRHFFTKDTSTGGASRQEYGVFLRDQGLTFERIINGDGKACSFPSSTVADAKWHYFAATYDGAQLQLYVDALEPKKTSDNRLAKSKDLPLYVGARGVEFGTMNGSLDEVAVYDRALAADRVKAHFDARPK